ncbi:MAG: hypothetical protein NTY64_19235 [Deltaproteobacteria bacterium]|nr:hypothetical protein [Deltaproteobacteria bacterium]
MYAAMTRDAAQRRRWTFYEVQRNAADGLFTKPSKMRLEHSHRTKRI